MITKFDYRYCTHGIINRDHFPMKFRFIFPACIDPQLYVLVHILYALCRDAFSFSPWRSAADRCRGVSRSWRTTKNHCPHEPLAKKPHNDTLLIDVSFHGHTFRRGFSSRGFTLWTPFVRLFTSGRRYSNGHREKSDSPRWKESIRVI